MFHGRSEPQPKPARIGAVLLVSLSLSACASWVLPRQTDTTIAVFDSYEAAQATYEAIRPFRTTTADLKALALDPETTPNLTVVTYLEIMRRFLPYRGGELAELEPGVQACIRRRDACSGWVVALGRVERRRVGDVIPDVLGFERETLSEGWNAEMFLLIADDLIVHKLWSGTKHIAERSVEIRPMGPLQDLSGAAGSIR